LNDAPEAEYPIEFRLGSLTTLNTVKEANKPNSSNAPEKALMESNVVNGPHNDTFLSDYAYCDECCSYDNFDDALAAALYIYPDCKGTMYA
jgi:hypothetical protein